MLNSNHSAIFCVLPLTPPFSQPLNVLLPLSLLSSLASSSVHTIIPTQLRSSPFLFSLIPGTCCVVCRPVWVQAMFLLGCGCVRILLRDPWGNLSLLKFIYMKNSSQGMRKSAPSQSQSSEGRNNPESKHIIFRSYRGWMTLGHISSTGLKSIFIGDE